MLRAVATTERHPLQCRHTRNEERGVASGGGRGQQAGQVTELVGGGQEPKGRVVVEKV